MTGTDQRIIKGAWIHESTATVGPDRGGALLTRPRFGPPPVDPDPNGADNNGWHDESVLGRRRGAGPGAALTIIGAGYGFGRIGSAALESMARQPEVAPRVQTGMIIIAALLEGATFFALIVCIIIAGKLGQGASAGTQIPIPF